MIKSITLKNWKSFGEATLYVDPLTVLIGTNASGKSNFLDALVFLGELGQGRSVAEALRGTGNGYKGIRGGKESVIRSGQTTTSIQLVFAVSDKDDHDYSYAFTVVKDDNYGYLIGEESLTITQEGKTTEFFTFRMMQHTFLEMNVERWGNIDLKEKHLVEALSVGTRQLRVDLKLLRVIDPIPQNMRNYTELSKQLAADGSNLAGYFAGSNEKKDLEDRLSIALRKLPENEIVRVWAEPVGRLATDAMLYCEEIWTSGTEPLLVDARGMSDGTLRLIAILTALLTASEGSTLVIEEIDNGIHPSRAGLLVKLLHEIGTERKVDIICTTHNPALLDAFGLSMLPFISLVYRNPENGTSQIKNLDEIKNYERIITKGSLGDLITKGRFEVALKAS